MSKFSRRSMVVSGVVIALVLVFSIAYAITWADTGNTDPDPDGNNYNWSGNVTRDAAASDQKYVCVLFTGGIATDPLLCSGLLTDALAPYTCTIPYADVNDSTTWQLAIAPTAACTGFGDQEPGPSGSLDPTAISLSSFLAQDGGVVSLPFAVLAVLAGGTLVAMFFFVMKKRDAAVDEG